MHPETRSKLFRVLDQNLQLGELDIKEYNDIYRKIYQSANMASLFENYYKDIICSNAHPILLKDELAYYMSQNRKYFICAPLNVLNALQTGHTRYKLHRYLYNPSYDQDTEVVYYSAGWLFYVLDINKDWSIGV